MKIFLSWSGEPSRTVARTLRHWLPDVIQFVEPWMSELDLEAGARWNEKIQRELSETRFGILCVTPQNVTAPWLLFEAGALAKTLQGTYVCPYLIGIEPSALPQGPLAQFQAKRANLIETRELVMTVNQSLGEATLDPARVERGFERWWPDLDKVLTSLPRLDSGNSAAARRSSEEMLEEILLLVRKMDRQERSSLHWQPSKEATQSVMELLLPSGREILNPVCLNLGERAQPLTREQIKAAYVTLRDALAQTHDDERSSKQTPAVTGGSGAREGES
jgi:hypothetical protein